ncbi:MAG: hypothetical protein P8Z30_10090 [Acidobacteriota bacterium]
MTCRHNPAAVPAGPPRRFLLRIPMLLVWVLLLPLVLLLAQLVFVACLMARRNPFRGVAALWELFSGLRGVRVTVDDPGAAVSIRIT